MIRLITHRQEQIYRMRHHDFGGMATKQVAAMLGVTPKCINSHMRQMRKIAPQLFPILTQRQMDVYVLYEKMGMTHPEVEKCLNMSAGTSGATVWYMRKKGMYLQPDCLHRVDTYSLWMDSKVRRKF